MCCLFSTLCSSLPAQQARWTETQANAWYAQQTWPVGANFLPSNAINQLEMWQADTFDPVTIDRELGWAQAIGMNTMRVFLHNLLWEQDPKASRIAWTHSSPSLPVTTSGPSLFSLTPAGIRAPNSVRSIRPFLVSTTPAGYRLQALKSFPTRLNSRALRAMSKVSSVPLPTTRASLPGICGTSPTTTTPAPMTRAILQTKT